MHKSLRDTLQNKTIEYILHQPEYWQYLKRALVRINKVAAEATTEATIAFEIDSFLHQLLKNEFGMNLKFVKEEATSRRSARGRIDTRIGLLILEYKHPSKLVTETQQFKASNQIAEYLETACPSMDTESVGIITDGKLIKFVHSSQPTKGGFAEITTAHLDQMVKYCLMLNKRALSPANLVADFCGEDSISKQLAKNLFHALDNDNWTPKTKMLYQEWKVLFKLAHDDTSKQQAIVERKDALANALDIKINPSDNETEYKALYAIQTAYAIIVKLMAYKVLASIQRIDDIDFAAMAQSKSTLRSALENLENGSVFRQCGFTNLLEGDFFAWYAAKGQWTEDIEKSIKLILNKLSEYEQHHILQTGWAVKDIFKGLYEAIIPSKVRHSLGEFYTPPWLADHVIQGAITLCKKSKGWSGLDPCCGSGTYVTTMIRRIIEELAGESNSIILAAILSRVKGVDLNPLAVLTARINYFINIAPLIDSNTEGFEIPIYLGDSSYIPVPILVSGVKCVQYELGTLKGPLSVTLPESAISDSQKFSKVMTEVEAQVLLESVSGTERLLQSLVAKADLIPEIKHEINNLARQLVNLQTQKWNGIWARIITNFLTTSNLGKFDIIVGNPPWVDWKNLPAGYRERIKGLCVSRNLFSGDNLTGGINLNICALIANVAADKWLHQSGVLGFLMPDTLMVQQTYEGFRQFKTSTGQLFLQKIINWSRAGHPFHPVTQKFLTYYYGASTVDYKAGVPVENVKRNPLKKGAVHKLPQVAFKQVAEYFESYDSIAITANPANSSFTYAQANEVREFSRIAGNCDYAGREGVEFFPNELLLFSALPNRKAKPGLIWVKNIQNSKSKHKVASQTLPLEQEMLFPLIKGVDIQRFGLKLSGTLAPFPYADNCRSPLSQEILSEKAPKLLNYLMSNKGVFDAQTSYNSKIIGKKHNNEFYALARVGTYSFAPVFVAFRDNSKWGATVVTQVQTPWGDLKRPVFQNHAVTITQRPDKTYISLEEAHYICAILNAPVVEKFIRQSSDSRTFKINPAIKVPIWDPANPIHKTLSDLSIKAHKFSEETTPEERQRLDAQLDEYYLALIQAI